jgi:hypothetical protein
MATTAYLNCYYIGIYILCMSIGRQHAGENFIAASIESEGIRVLMHILYVIPFFISTFGLYHGVVRDCSLLMGVLELQEEAV